MQKLNKIVLSCFVVFSSVVNAGEKNFDYTAFAKAYFSAFNQTQKPKATKKDLENYLSFLTDDVAHQHLPYDTTDTRNPGGKEELRQGMTRWLAVNTEYKAELISIAYERDVVVIKYRSTVKLNNENTGKELVINRKRLEVLELDNEKVAIIRKYGK